MKILLLNTKLKRSKYLLGRIEINRRVGVGGGKGNTTVAPDTTKVSD